MLLNATTTRGKDPRESEIRAPRQLTIALKLSYYLFIIAKLFKVKDGCLKFVIPAKAFARDYVITGVGLSVWNVDVSTCISSTEM